MITVNSRKYDGSIRRTWTCELLERDGSLLRMVGEFDTDVMHTDLGHIKKGTLSYEYYWLDRWYNIFRFHEPSGKLRNFYCNINMPPAFENGVLDYVDLDIDVLIQSDLSFTVLDREDFEESAEAFDYPQQLRTKVERTLDELVGFIENRHVPGLPELFAISDAMPRVTRG
jgi:protein associated with RNAse G/E